jgi:hypothetical protein
VAYSYDVTTDRGAVRLLANDNDETTHLFEDAEIDRFLGLADGVLRAAALACLAIAGNENLIQKKLTFLAGAGIQTDGPAVAKEMRELAKAYNDRADNAPGDEAGMIDVAEFGFDPFSARDILVNDWLRERA